MRTAGRAPFLRWNCWTLGPVLLFFAAVATPYFSTHSLLAFAFVLHSGFALVCHQQPERCFWIFGAPIAVCARCLGIYLGAAIGLLLRTSRILALRLLIVASTLNLLDALTELAGLHGNWTAIRFLLGMALGLAGALLISSSIKSSATPAATAPIESA